MGTSEARAAAIPATKDEEAPGAFKPHGAVAAGGWGQGATRAQLGPAIGLAGGWVFLFEKTSWPKKREMVGRNSEHF